MIKRTFALLMCMILALSVCACNNNNDDNTPTTQPTTKESMEVETLPEIKKPDISEEYIRFYLEDIRDKVFSAEDRTEAIIDTFVNAVYLYDDKLILTFNLKDGEGLKKLEFSDLSKFASPSSSMFGFSPERFTITILSELFIFGTAIKIRRD